MLKFSKAAIAFGFCIYAGTGFATAETASDKGFAAAMQGMMHAMMQPATGKPDFDFVTGMIPHHEGAVAMAKVEKQFGKDRDMLKLADDIMAAQTSEIALMKGWLSAKQLSSGAAIVAAKRPPSAPWIK